MMADTSGILSGLKVLDVGTFIFGPAATTVLADFGADVIKVESPGIGDPYRYLYMMPPFPKCDDELRLGAHGAQQAEHRAQSEGRSTGREVLRKLVADADVLVTNYHPSVLSASRHDVRRAVADQFAARLRARHRIRGQGRGSREAGLRRDGVVGTVGPHGSRAGGGRGARPVAAGDGGSSGRHGAVSAALCSRCISASGRGRARKCRAR